MKWFKYDSNGVESRTYRVVMLSWSAVWVKFLLAGVTIPGVGTVATMTATEFGAATAAIMAVWLGREFIRK